MNYMIMLSISNWGSTIFGKKIHAIHYSHYLNTYTKLHMCVNLITLIFQRKLVKVGVPDIVL